MRAALCTSLALAALLAVLPARADGSSAAAGLSAAERAYQEVDFPAAHELAQRALEAGGARSDETARLSVLLGISAAAQGNAAEAQQRFVLALALDPTLRLDKALSPKIRGPYLEAQGYWGAAAERLALRAKPSNDASHLVVELLDPAGLVSKLSLRVRGLGERRWLVFPREAGHAARFALPARLAAQSYEYSVVALDRYGNTLLERGSDADPELVRAAPAPTAVDRYEISALRRERSYVWPVTLASAGLAAVAAGVVFNVQREQAAHEWDGPGCEKAGQTRFQQCEGIDARRQTAERLAIGFYAGGGALLTGSVIALLAGGPSEGRDPQAGALGCGVGFAAVSCRGRF